jgi:hypothetical protein
VTAQQLVKLLFWFSQAISVQYVASYLTADRGTIGACYMVLRCWLGYTLVKTFDELLGGGQDNDNIVMVLDECYVKKYKRHPIRGRHRRAHHVLLFGGVELEK